MASNRAPAYKNPTTGNVTVFGGEDAIAWNFTSAAGNPLTLSVSGSPYFTMERTGEFQLESSVTWNADTGGNIGEQYDHRPAYAYVATQTAVGAALGVGDGTRVSLNTILLGHGNVDKQYAVDQGLGGYPALRYKATTAKWQYSDDGVAWVNFGSGVATPITWDDVYATDKTLDIDSTVLTFSQSSTTGIGFTVSRNLTAASTDAPIMTASNIHASDDQVALQVLSAGGPTLAITLSGAPAAMVDATASTVTASGALGAASDVRAYNATITPNAGDNAGAYYQGYYATGSATGSATKYGFRADANWDRGLYSIPPIEISTASAVGEAALKLDQNDDDQAFIYFDGATSGSYDSTKNLTTWQGGAGAVVGPLGQAVAESAWAWGGMMRQEVNGATVWTPYFTYVP